HYSSLPDTQPNHVNPPHYTIEKLMAFLGSDRPDWHMRPLTIQPGTKWIYSNTGFGLLGVAMEKISGLTYQSLLDTIFCNELGMPDTRVQLNSEQLSRLATGYHHGDSVKYTLTSPAFYGAGGNFSCMNDMLKYLAWNMGLTNSTLNNLLDTLHTARDTTTRASAWQGLAWQISPLRPQSKQNFVWKDGATTGYTAFICFVPETKTGVMVLANNFDQSVQFDKIGIAILRILNPPKEDK
ncbi:MAG: serine hydrolase domain-containing protein, partial [Chitinophagaceae bacterium]